MDLLTRDQIKHQLAALSPQQRARLRDAVQRRAAPRSATGSIYSRFAPWVLRTPAAVAVRCGAEQLTYAQLDARASEIGSWLLAAGLRQGELVALSLDRGLELVAAILGILKAGGAYLPIDPTVPEQRQAFIREDARPAAIISESKYRGRYSHCAVPVLYVDELPSGTACDRVWPEVRGEDLAYVIYTSGSTGNPKGVMVEHRHVVRLFTAADQCFEFSARDVWTLFHSYAFDFSVWEIWGALFYGGRLLVIPYLLSRSALEFATLLLEEGVTVLNQTPSAFSNLMPQLLQRAQPGALRYVIFGGEALEPRRLLPWLQKFGEQAPELINMYGITETTVHVTFKQVLQRDAEAGYSDIGVPLADLQLYVLNERRRPVPDGVIGELYVAGAGVSRGYLNRPELTAERFIPSPFVPGETLYKTGDLARRLDGGTLEYVGRNDNQIKLRGFRIELGDIEKQLLGHASVHDAVAALHGEGAERQLVAYLVLERAATPQWRAALLTHLRQSLPDYMVPARPVLLERLPLTENGKIDRSGLPAPTPQDVWMEAYVAPATPAETLLCELYARTLGVAQVGARDNFFSLGGDSLKTVNLVALAKAAGLQFSVADIFTQPCVADLAALAQWCEARAGEAVAPFALISAADRERLPNGVVAAYPVSHMQQGMIFHNLESSDNRFYHNVLSQRYRGEVDFERLRRATEQVIATHEILRTSFHLTGYSEPLQLVHEHVPAPLFIEDLRHLPAEQQLQRVSDELARLRQERFVLTAPPLFKAHVYRVSDAEFELIWLEHHAVLDGWSLASFMTQLMSAYAAVKPPAPLDTGYYRELIAAERDAASDPAQRRFWNDYLAGSSFTQLQGAGRSVQDEIEAVAPLEVPAALFTACRTVAANLGVPLKSLFLAAYAQVISRFSNEPDVLFGITTHGRPDHEHSAAMLGLYVSTHPLRVATAGSSWRELIMQCAQQEARVWAHRFYPIAAIKRLRGGAELFETSFTFNHFSITQTAEDIGIRPLRQRRAFEFDEIGLGIACIISGPDMAKCQLHVGYNPARFPAAFCRRVQHYLLEALRQLAKDPQARAEVLAEADLQLLGMLGRLPVPVLPGATLLQEFAALVHAAPDARVAEQGADNITYQQLEQRSSVLAGHLARSGVGMGSLVGFDCPPSIDLLIGLLAVWKLGAAFVPLDPEQTEARVAAIIAESQLSHLLTTQQRAARAVPAGVAVATLEQLSALHGEPHAAAPIDSSTLAYVIYTSGSTGKPKGVAVSHGSAVSFRRASARSYQIGSGERVLQFSNMGFDIFIEELMASVLSGGTLVLLPRVELLEPRRFWSVLAERAISFCSLPTAYWSLLCSQLAHLRPEVSRLALRTCAVGGEAMQAERLSEWLRYFGTRIALWNTYGPAEATSIATVFDTRLLHRQGNFSNVPIGVPLDNASCWVLGKDQQPVPPGVTGELYIGGNGLARCYLNDPAQTQARFVTLALPGAGEQRLYRTGDLVRYTASGLLEFVGRSDAQVKIRGFRVELEEIRHLIGAQREVAHCAVVPYEPDAHWRRQLREQLATALPEYMLPASFVAVESFPVTANGKLDLPALLELCESGRPAQSTSSQSSAQLAPEDAFWRDYLCDLPQRLDYPADHMRPALPLRERASVPLRLSPALLQALEAAALRHATTWRSLVLAAWTMLLWRWGDADELVLGIVPETVAGDAIHALRVRPEGQTTALDLVRQIEAGLQQVQARAARSATELARLCAAPWTLGYNPVFQVSCSIGAAAVASTCTTDLELLVQPAGARLTGQIDYAAGLFDAATMERLGERLQLLLTELARDPARALECIPQCTAAEREQMLTTFNATARDTPRPALIHELFEHQARLRPDAIAVIDEQRELSYAELNALANSIAAQLLAAGVQREDRVALYLQRDCMMVAAVLGILKAGGAYVPLDSSNTAERLAAIVADCAPRVVLAPQACAAQFAGTLPQLLTFEALAAAPVGSADPGVPLLPGTLAYLIYTSGSTGRPKGVMVEHAAVINLWAALEAEVFGHWPMDARVGLSASLAFDASVQSLLQLLAGRTVVVIPQHARLDPPVLLELIERQQLHGFDCTPTQLQELVEHGLLRRPRGRLSDVLVGGEAMTPGLWEKLGRSEIRFFNAYGPTECTVDATLGAIGARDWRCHIGRPLANTRAYVLDGRGEPVPLGARGELYLAGVGVARGYWNRPELTAQHFIKDPFDPAGGRMYRTGDLVRWLADGRLEYLGRRDTQVKLRGFRIELAEIQARLDACESVQQSAVAVREVRLGERAVVAFVKRARLQPAERGLAAYVVLQPDAKPGALARIQASVRETLPGYMQPSGWRVLERLPLTVNGKVDVQALPAPEGVRCEAVAAPSTASELQLQRLWEDVLGHACPDAQVDFFACGGHSLLLTRLLLRIGEACGVQLSIAELMRKRTLREMAALIDAARSVAAAHPAALPVAEGAVEEQEW
jgi:amino acid adenylation domain-containing protein